MQQQTEKVSIVIPVYNAEPYLGYCLNSVLAQTYTNFEAILVDDGSTDASAEICRRYVEVDARFRLISQANGGVSKARNAGVEAADGDYLTFIDSDDMVSTEMLALMVGRARCYQKDLVVCNMQMVDFDHPDKPTIKLCSDYLGKECVLSQKVFGEYKMRLIWHTCLLEGPCAKLYSLKLWKENSIKFPEDVSLGEDFLANMHYYSVCDGAVFLNQIVYYYHNADTDASLTHRYREDIFEIKHMLLKELQAHLKSCGEVGPEEEKSFYNYAVATFFGCISNLTGDTSPLSQDEQKARIANIVNEPLFRKSCKEADYMEDGYKKASLCVEKCDVGTLFEMSRQGKLKVTPPAMPLKLGSRVVRKLARIGSRVFGGSKLGVRCKRLEEKITLLGLRRALKG